MYFLQSIYYFGIWTLIPYIPERTIKRTLRERGA